MLHHLEERAIWISRHILPHEPALRAWLRRRPVLGLDIDDIVQETYVRLAAIDSVDDIHDARTYMFQAALSIVMNHVRRARIVSIRAVAALEELGAAAPDPSPERQVVDRDELQRLAEFIAALPDKPREIVILRRIQGLSQRDTAARLGISEKTVEKHMGRAIRLMMAAFGRGGKNAAGASKQREQDQDQDENQGIEPTY